MKNVSIFHGTGGTPGHFWFPYLKDNLEIQGYLVWVPQLPDTDTPDIKKWLPFVQEHGSFDQESVLVGHSAGCPLILSLLETLDKPVHQVILVAGFTEPLDENPEPILQDSYDWKKIKSNVKRLYFINSDNDPWGCDDKAGKKMFDNLGGNLIIRHGEGHMGSGKFNQPYKEFPLVLKIIEAEAYESRNL